MAGVSKTFVVTFTAQGGWGDAGHDKQVHATHGRGDRVRWSNETKKDKTIKFTRWPFTGRKHVIKAMAGKKSATLKIKSAAPKDTYGYAVNPKVRKKGPPDGPAVVVNGP